MSPVRRKYESVVSRPGKFEREEPYVPYFWDMFLNGFASEDDGEILTFNIQRKDIAHFPELRGRERISLVETENGFVVEVNK